MGQLPGHDRFDHGARRLAVEIADDDAQTNTAVGQYLVQSVFLRGQLADRFLPLATDQAPLTEFGRRYERAAQQSRACQRRQLMGITYIRLAAGNILDVPGIHHLGANALRV